MMCWLFHKWSKWEQYDQPMIEFSNGCRFVQHWQKRKCENCGKEQREEIFGD